MIDYYIQEYKKGKSIKEIAQSAGTYYSKVRRALIKNGVTIRNKSEAYKSSLEAGKTKHPTAGRKRREDEIIKISKSQSKRWEEMTEQKRSMVIEQRKKEWANKTEEFIQQMKDKAFSRIRQAAKLGSSLERYIASELKLSGYNVQFHKENLLPNEKMNIDIFLPDLYTAVEIDGPSHFSPIWGEEALRRNQLTDKQKNGLLTGNGYNIVRLQAKFKYKSMSKFRLAFSVLLDLLRVIEKTKSRSKSYLLEVL